MKIAISENAWAPSEERRALPILGNVEGICVSLQRLENGVRCARQSVFTRSRSKRRELLGWGKTIPLVECIADKRHGNLQTEAGRAGLVSRIELGLQAAHEMEAEAITVLGPSLRRIPDFLPHLWERDWFYLSERAQEYGVRLILEPVPRVHATRFWYSAETVEGFLLASNSFASVGLDSAALAFEEQPRSVLNEFAGQASIFMVSEPGQGPIAARGPVPHRRIASDLGRLKRAGRAPEWLGLRYRRPETAVLETLSSSIDRLRILYASPLRV